VFLVGKWLAMEARVVSMFVALQGAIRAAAALNAVGGASAVASAGLAKLGAIIRVHPLTFFVGLLGTVVGGLALLDGQQQRTRVSAEDLAEAYKRQRDALVALRDLDLDAANKKLSLERATQTLRDEEARLSQMRKTGTASANELRRQETAVKAARVELERATRDYERRQNAANDATDEAAKATLDATSKSRQRVAQLAAEAAKLALTAGNSDEYRAKLKELKAAMDALENKTLKVDVMLNIGAQAGKSAKTVLGGKGGTSLESFTRSEAKKKAQAMVDSNPASFLGAGVGGVGGKGGSLGAATALAATFGLGVTSGFRPGDPGWHGKNRARDYGGSPGAMLAFARAMAATFGGSLLELIHTPMGFGVKNGSRVGLGFWGPAVNADHFDHVHVAMRRGGKAGPGSGGPSVVYGEGRRAEWWISQEGDRRKNIGWAMEALKSLSPNRVAKMQDGGTSSDFTGSYGGAVAVIDSATGQVSIVSTQDLHPFHGPPKPSSAGFVNPGSHTAEDSLGVAAAALLELLELERDRERRYQAVGSAQDGAIARWLMDKLNGNLGPARSLATVSTPGRVASVGRL
jgi:hypothetical protein